jgi:glyoxylase-like metal-dependent hydrolase (beta-lactamase superfamily II)
VSTTRRAFLQRSGSCAAHLALAAVAMPDAARLAWARAPLGRVLAREPFGSLEKVADGVWALISTPLGGDRTTLSNGGIIAGRNAVLAIEGFNQPQGAEWMAARARDLTGKWPTHVALTHYHADHANGVAGYLTGAQHPVVRSTARTRDLVVERNQPADPARIAAVQDAVIISGADVTTLDLGGRTVRIVPRGGHTDSDISLELDDPSLVFCGDLFWNAMFPNFVDGAMLGEVEAGARRAFSVGTSAADGGAAFTLPASLGEWTLFNKVFYQRAFEAWFKELT